jgi:restriction system protein
VCHIPRVMPRRYRRSSGSDLVDTAALFQQVPFIYSVIASVVVALLAEVAAPLLAPLYPKTNGINFASMFLPFIQIIGGFFAAAIFLFGLWGAVSRSLELRDDRNRFDRQTGVDSIRRLDWQEFERLLGEAYRRQGFDVIRRGGPVADGGADLELRKNGERLLVQAKHWRARVVRLPQVRELWGAVADEHADGGIFVTSGTFTDDARGWTKNKNLTLVDGDELARMITATQNAGVRPVTAEHQVCQRCGRQMVIRTAKQGPLAGKSFWGCTGYPSCRYTASITA